MNIVAKRNKELLAELKNFITHVINQNPNLRQNRSLHFTLTLAKKKRIKCQYREVSHYFELENSKTSYTLLKRLSFLQSNKHLEFGQDTENHNLFNVEMKCGNNGEARQLQFAL